jgi:hypothetical protein
MVVSSVRGRFNVSTLIAFLAVQKYLTELIKQTVGDNERREHSKAPYINT